MHDFQHLTIPASAAKDMLRLPSTYRALGIAQPLVNRVDAAKNPLRRSATHEMRAQRLIRGGAIATALLHGAGTTEEIMDARDAVNEACAGQGAGNSPERPQ
jgi:hypothetical protein